MINDILQETPNIVSFDFDDTLSMPIYEISSDYSEFSFENPTKLSQKIKKIIEDFHAKGATIYLITSRKDTPENRAEVSKFLTDNNIRHYFTDLIFTGDDKAQTLKEIGSEIHFDDDEYEFKILKEKYPESHLKFIQIKHEEEPGKFRSEEDWIFKRLSSLSYELQKLNSFKALKELRRLLKE